MDVLWQICGRVQRVGFRYWTVQMARQCGKISGYVMNTDDGCVVVRASGENGDLSKFKQLLYRGPFFARVDYIRDISFDKTFFPPIVNGVFKKL